MLLPCQVIYQGSTDQCHPRGIHYAKALEKGWHITQIANHWADIVTTMAYVKKVLLPYYKNMCILKGLPYKTQKIIFIIDCWSVHCSSHFRAWMQHYPFILTLYVPPNMTSVAQPADCGIQKPIKARVSHKFHEWLVSERRRLPAGTRLPLSMSNIKGAGLGWLYDTWLALHGDPSLIRAAWANAGLDRVLQADYQAEVKREAFQLNSPLLTIPQPKEEDDVTFEIAVENNDLEPDECMEQGLMATGEDAGEQGGPGPSGEGTGGQGPTTEEQGGQGPSGEETGGQGPTGVEGVLGDDMPLSPRRAEHLRMVELSTAALKASLLTMPKRHLVDGKKRPGRKRGSSVSQSQPMSRKPRKQPAVMSPEGEEVRMPARRKVRRRPSGPPVPTTETEDSEEEDEDLSDQAFDEAFGISQP